MCNPCFLRIIENNHNVEGAHQCKYSMSTKPQFRGFLTHVHPFAICLVLTCLLLFFNVFFFRFVGCGFIRAARIYFLCNTPAFHLGQPDI